MLPTVVLGHALRPSAGEAAVIRAEIAMMAEDLLSSEGRTTRDLEVAERDNLSDGGSRVSVVAVRLPGVKALRLLDAYLGGFVASPFGHVSERQLNGRAVSCTFRDGNPIWVCWWPRHDVVFGASSDEFLLIREGIAAIV